MRGERADQRTLVRGARREMGDILDAAGVPFCKGGVMARNRSGARAWRWRDTIDGWVRRQRPAGPAQRRHLLRWRAGAGDAALGEAIWDHAYDRGHAAPDFQNLLIELARKRGRAFHAARQIPDRRAGPH